VNYRIKILLVFLIISSGSFTASANDEIKKKQEELQKLRKEIDGWEKKLEHREKRERATLEVLDTYDRQLTLIRKLTNRLIDEETLLRREIDNTQKNILGLDNRLQFIKKQYSNYVLAAYKNGRTYDLELLISSKSFNQLYIRSEYLKRFSDQRRKDIVDIDKQFTELEKQNEILQKQLNKQRLLIEAKNREEQKIVQKSAERKKILRDIKRDKANYEREVIRKRQAVKDLENLIAKLIELDQQRKIAESKLSRKREPSEVNTKNIASKFEANRGKLPWPVTGGKIISKFGNIQHPVLKTISQNTGIDLEVPVGTNVHAVAEGEVSTIWWLPSFGNLVILNHNNGYRTVYAHLSDIVIEEGETISSGALIGKSGETINGSTVHFELWKDRDKQDPEIWLHPRGLTKR
jgi:septal ring factor EnvC (AmiA/AmiB activator)